MFWHVIYRGLGLERLFGYPTRTHWKGVIIVKYEKHGGRGLKRELRRITWLFYGRALENVGSYFLKILNFLLEMVYKSIFSIMYGVVMLLQRIYSLIYLFCYYASVVSYIGVLVLFVLCKIGNWNAWLSFLICYIHIWFLVEV